MVLNDLLLMSCHPSQIMHRIGALDCLKKLLQLTAAKAVGEWEHQVLTVKSGKREIAPHGKRVVREACFGQNFAIFEGFYAFFRQFRDCGPSQSNLRCRKGRIASKIALKIPLGPQRLTQRSLAVGVFPCGKGMFHLHILNP